MIQLPNKNLENTNTKQVKTECTKWCEAVHLSPLSQQLATAFSSEPRNQEPKNQEDYISRIFLWKVDLSLIT